MFPYSGLLCSTITTAPQLLEHSNCVQENVHSLPKDWRKTHLQKAFLPLQRAGRRSSVGARFEATPGVIDLEAEDQHQKEVPELR